MSIARWLLLPTYGKKEINVLCPTITPTFGAQLLGNPGFEVAGGGGADVFADWSEGTAGASTLSQDGVNQRSGSWCCQFDIDAVASTCNVQQGGPVIGTWYQMSMWAMAVAGNPQLVFGKIGQPTAITGVLAGAYAQYVCSFRATTTQNFYVTRAGGVTSVTSVIDDTLARAITFSSMHTPLGNRKPMEGVYTCHPTAAYGSQCGMLIHYADASNFVMAYVERLGTTNDAYLVSCIGGTYAVARTGVIAYGAGGALTVTVDTAGNYQLAYGGVNVGAAAAIAQGTLGYQVHGFNTYDGNTVGQVTTAKN